MTNHYGGIFKINRLEQNVVLEGIVRIVDQDIIKIKNTGVLSNIERQKDTLKEDKVAYLFSLLNLDFDLSKQDEINEIVEKYFNLIIDKRIENMNYEQDYNYIVSRENEIKTSLSYPKYLLIKLNVSLHQQLNNIDYDLIFNTLLEHKDYLENYQISNLYFNKGLYLIDKLKYLEALEWFNEAMKYSIPTNYKGIIHFQRSTAFDRLGEHILAIEDTNKAKECFDKILCYKKSLACYFKMGVCYAQIGKLEEAKQIYYNLIHKSKEYGREDLLPLVQNNLCWVDIREKDYESLVDNAKKLLNYDTKKPDAYFYLSWGYAHINQLDQAKENIILAKQYKDHCDSYMARMITIYARYFSLRSKVENIKRDLYELYSSMKKKHFNHSATVFVLEMLIEICHNDHDYEKESTYLKEYIQFSLKKK